MYGLLLALHLIAATIWTGGHIVLSLVILPKVLKRRSAQLLLDFESAYEKIGMPALIIQVVTGLMLAYHLLPDVSLWFDMSVPVAHGIAAKLSLLALTVLFALDARFRVIPKLSEANLVDMAWHIIPVTVFSVLFVLAGVSFRAGWLV
ncbi:CopD family protein [Thalassomonas viridans]|uniref:CopD family protein n=1 Tax=Thalassomonas viridans TaxID=137584 RepID=A0AAE9Z5Z8_9GAMM|nr:CopD family protein [Thalassomonas viridans]WDE06694.1 CopD family protein [Thalassomonas viridans]